MTKSALIAILFSATILIASDVEAGAAPCSSFPYVLVNGTTADAGQVMADFDCVALTSGSTLTNIAISGTTSLPGLTTFTSDGTILVGKTAPDSNSKGVTLSPDGSVAFTADLAGGHYSITNSTSGPGTWMQFRNYGGVVGSISIGSSSTAFNTTSDMRLKSPLSVQKDYHSALKNLWVGDFEWKQTHIHGFGILAQQAYALFPDAITPPRNSTEFWQADYGKLAPLAIWGVKDLYKVTEIQSAQISALRAEISALKSQTVAMQRGNADEILELKRLNASISEARRPMPKMYRAHY